MTIIFDTVTKPIVGAEWANAKVVVAPVAPFFAADGREVAGTKFVLTDLVGYAEFDLEPTVGATPSGCWYVWTNPDGSQRAFTVPATGGPYSLQACLIAAPQNPGVINGGLTLAELESQLGGTTLPLTGPITTIDDTTVPGPATKARSAEFLQNKTKQLLDAPGAAGAGNDGLIVADALANALTFGGSDITVNSGQYALSQQILALTKTVWAPRDGSTQLHQTWKDASGGASAGNCLFRNADWGVTGTCTVLSGSATTATVNTVTSGGPVTPAMVGRRIGIRGGFALNLGTSPQGFDATVQITDVADLDHDGIYETLTLGTALTNFPRAGVGFQITGGDTEIHIDDHLQFTGIGTGPVGAGTILLPNGAAHLINLRFVEGASIKAHFKDSAGPAIFNMGCSNVDVDAIVENSGRDGVTHTRYLGGCNDIRVRIKATYCGDDVVALGHSGVGTSGLEVDDETPPSGWDDTWPDSGKRCSADVVAQCYPDGSTNSLALGRAVALFGITGGSTRVEAHNSAAAGILIDDAGPGGVDPTTGNLLPTVDHTILPGSKLYNSGQLAAYRDSRLYLPVGSGGAGIDLIPNASVWVDNARGCNIDGVLSNNPYTTHWWETALAVGTTWGPNNQEYDTATGTYKLATSGGSVTVVATSNIALTTSTTVIDGHTLVAGDTVLATAQSTASQNGIYRIPPANQSHATNFPTTWQRVLWARPGTTFRQAEVTVINGGNAGTRWRCYSATALNIGTDAQTWKGIYPTAGNIITSNIYKQNARQTQASGSSTAATTPADISASCIGGSGTTTTWTLQSADMFDWKNGIVPPSGVFELEFQAFMKCAVTGAFLQISLYNVLTSAAVSNSTKSMMSGTSEQQIEYRIQLTGTPGAAFQYRPQWSTSVATTAPVIDGGGTIGSIRSIAYAA